MKSLFKRTPLFVSTVLAVGAFTVFAKTSPTFEIHTSVVLKAAQSEKGVILVLTERGDIAAEAAYLLLAQIKQNEGYAPLFIAIESDKVAGYRNALGLPGESLPAVIFFNKSGKEIVRVVAAKSAMAKSGQLQDRVS